MPLRNACQIIQLHCLFSAMDRWLSGLECNTVSWCFISCGAVRQNMDSWRTGCQHVRLVAFSFNFLLSPQNMFPWHGCSQIVSPAWDGSCTRCFKFMILHVKAPKVVALCYAALETLNNWPKTSLGKMKELIWIQKVKSGFPPCLVVQNGFVFFLSPYIVVKNFASLTCRTSQVVDSPLAQHLLSHQRWYLSIRHPNLPDYS